MGVTQAAVKLRLLGGFAVTGGAPEENGWRLRKAKTLVKLLALAPGHHLHRDALIDTLWPDHDPAAATNNLHQAMHAARRALGGQHVVLRDQVVALSSVSVDVDEFIDCAARAQASGDLTDLRAAADLWTGELLPEDMYADWASPYRDRLDETHAAVVTQLAAVLTEADAADDAIALLDPLASRRPHDEPLHRTLLTALAASGRRFDALAAYERLRDALDTEFAAEPQPETKALYRRLLGAGSAVADVPHNLPTSTSSFIGRRRELAELAGALERARVLTLTGPGGAGKTRLAIELARRRLPSGDHPDGAWFVDLASIQDPDLLPSAVASALRIPLSRDDAAVAALTAPLAGRQLLLLLDNCEHLLDHCAELSAALLAHCPGLVLLTTSREPLGLPGEVVYRVPSLQLPAPDDVTVESLSRLEAVQLFVERALDVAPTFAIDARTAPAVATICYRLDGIPLALELAAARLAHLSVHQLADRLGDALALLASHGRGRLDRQQTLAATLDWSHELLDEAERVVLRRLAVFAGDFDLDAAAYVCDVPGVIDVLARLVDKSLVHADTSGERARYRLLEVVRQYAELRLAETGDLGDSRRRHFEWFDRQAADHDPERGDPVVGDPSRWFDLEHDNIRTALANALTDEPSLALRLATSTWRFWLSRGLLVDGARWIGQALTTCPDQDDTRMRALFAAGVLQVRQGVTKTLPGLGDEIVTLARRLGDPRLLRQAHHQSAVFRFMSADWDNAALAIDETLQLAEDAPADAASVRNLAAILALTRGDVAAARAHWDAAYAVLDAVPDDTPPFFTAIFISWAIDERGDMPIAYGEETMLFGRRTGAAQARAHVLVGIAMTERLAGRFDDALRFLDDATTRFQEVGDRAGLAHSLSQRGHTLQWMGHHDEARELLRASEGLRRELRDHRGIALSLAGRAMLEAHAGNAAAARDLAAEAVAMVRATGDEPGLNLTLQDMAVVEVVLGDWAGAADAITKPLEYSHVPGAHRAAGWTHLMRAHILAQLGEHQGAAAAAGEALDVFRDLGEGRGVAAVQRACKAGRLRLPVDRTF
jgi:predicted ATPase/DNA-binding SARP family transcriptional activator